MFMMLVHKWNRRLEWLALPLHSQFQTPGLPSYAIIQLKTPVAISYSLAPPTIPLCRGSNRLALFLFVDVDALQFGDGGFVRVDLEPMVGDDEDHGCGAEEEGQ